MWCPEGYATFLEFEYRIRRLVRESPAPRFGFPEFHDYESYQIVLLNECFLEFARTCQSISVASPQGTTFRLPSRILSYGYCGAMGWAFSFVDKETGLVSAHQIEACHQAAQHGLKELRRIVDADADTPKEYATYLNLLRCEDDWAAWKELKAFDGWSVCCKESDVPKSADYFLSLDGTDDLIQFGETAMSVTAMSVTDEIVSASDEGTIASRDQFWKARFPNLKREAYRAAWRDAAKLRPELSKRGPKPMS
jgi:hypothetical protein